MSDTTGGGAETPEVVPMADAVEEAIAESGVEQAVTISGGVVTRPPEEPVDPPPDEPTAEGAHDQANVEHHDMNSGVTGGAA